MGSDYYAYAVIGVKANKYAKENRLTVQVQKQLRMGYNKPMQPVFAADGQPLMESANLEYIAFLDKNYVDGWQSEELRQGRSEINGVYFTEGKFSDALAEAELEWFSYDYNRVYANDIIGMKIASWDTDNTSEGVAQDDLPALFAEVKRRLMAIGIGEDPKLYASFYHSY